MGEFTLKGGETIAANVPEDGSREAYEMAAEIMNVDLSDYDLYLTADGGSYEYRNPDEAQAVGQAKVPKEKRGAKGQDR